MALGTRRLASLLVAAAVVAAPTAVVGTTSGPAQAAAARPGCHGLRATIVGTPRADRLRGTPRRDVIAGLGGDDTIDGRGGDDVICGGDGGDTLRGGAGDDRLLGGRARVYTDRGGTQLDPNRLVGGPGDDLLDPGLDQRSVSSPPDAVAGVLDLSGARSGLRVDLSGRRGTAVAGGDRDRVVVRPRMQLLGSRFDDEVVGSRWGDHVRTGAGDDLVDARGGDDEVYVDAESDGATPGDDVVQLGAGDDAAYSLDGDDQLSGGPGDDQLQSFSGTGRLLGEDGDDLAVLDVGLGQGYVLDGGPGDDTGSLAGLDDVAGLVGAAFTVRGASAPAGGTIERAGVVTGTVAGLETVELGFQQQWTYYGTDAPEEVQGGYSYPLQAFTYGGDDTVTGTEAADAIDAGAGVDTVDARPGTDTCVAVEKATSCEVLTP